MDKLISSPPRSGAIPKAQGPLGQAATMFFKNRGAVIGLALLVLIITASLVAVPAARRSLRRRGCAHDPAA